MQKQRGFTILELLVVIAVIGILSSVVLVSVSNARSRARDAIRKSDFNQIQKALELYYAKYGAYPSTSATGPAPGGGQWSTQSTWLSVLVTEGLFAKVPVDPRNIDTGPWCWGGNATQSGLYIYISDGTHYVLCGWLENANDAMALQNRDVPNPWNPTQYLRANYNYPNSGIVVTR